ncbi:peptide ABC transporter substrate-binding protein [Pseudalkalibacillus caeni]|uniref:Peptide ABC transporter substrate-binding protein n=1 Tax=Exobacillus caeni TaxID=2574798 RepID=A0A5R9FCH3_9BACL|nr:peptide ABC transporter substrate-binding protein [Pseudalkalibacillus caeni]TLS38254.1 peptide ABC transporter substrate-binding protein [Pseudalkalibacillus caeni]
MKNRKLTVLLSLVLILSLFLSACSGNQGASSNNGGNSSDGNSGNSGNEDKGSEDVAQVLNLYDSQDIPTMDSTQATDVVAFNAMNQVFEGLYRLDENNQPVLGVAAEEPQVEQKDGESVYTFKLREDAVWSDGSPVTANDFVYSWQKIAHPDTVGAYAFMLGVAGVKNGNAVITEDDPLYGKVEELGVKAVDDKTLEVTVTQEVPYFKDLLTFAALYPQPAEFAKEQGDKYALEPENMLYNGPFVLSEWKHGDSWKLTKNDKYWDKDVVKLEEANYKVIKDVATVVNLYETGKLHRAGLNAEFVDQFKDREDFGTRLDPTMFFLRLNEKHEALANADIRKALFLAYDRQGLVNVLLNNGSVEARYLVPKEFTFGPDGKDFREFAPDGFLADQTADDAKTYWDKGLKAIGKDKVELEFLTTDSELASKIAEYAKEQFEQKLPGLAITINKQPWKQFLDLEDGGDFDISTGGWGPDYPDPMTYVDMFVTDGPYNRMGYSNPKFDELVNKAKTEQDEAKRWEMLQQAEELLIKEDTAIIPTYQAGAAYLAKPEVKNYYIHPFGADTSLKWTYIEK